MAIETHTIAVTPETTVDEVLDAADDSPVLIERDGVVYLLRRERLEDSPEWDEERAKRVRKMLKETAGAWSDIDTKQLIDDIYRRRTEGSSPADRS